MMEAVLRFAPAPVLSRFWEAGAQALKTVRNLFAAKLLAANPAREDAQADVNARAAEILDTHGNAILRYAYSYLHNMEDAEEVLQDTLVQFLKTAPAFESKAHEKAWLLCVAGNLSKNRLSYNAVRAADELNDELSQKTGTICPSSGRLCATFPKNTARRSTCFTMKATRQSRSRKFCSAAKQPSVPICTGAERCCARF